jgi:hypothetical protein
VPFHRQHLQKLKKKEGTGDTPANSEEAGKSGGVAKGKAAKAKAAPGGKRRKAQQLVEAEDVDEDEEEEKPVKKIKLE